jgi:hypothetical protein
MKVYFQTSYSRAMLLLGFVCLFGSCNPLKDLKTVEVTFEGEDSFVVKEGSAAGNYAIKQKSINNNLNAFLRKNNIDMSDIVYADFVDASFTIPEESKLTFDKLDEGTFELEGLNQRVPSPRTTKKELDKLQSNQGCSVKSVDYEESGLVKAINFIGGSALRKMYYHEGCLRGFEYLFPEGHGKYAYVYHDKSLRDYLKSHMDLRDLLLCNDLEYNVNLKTNCATPRTIIKVKYKFNIGFEKEHR